MPAPRDTWRSCCLSMDPRAVVYFTQMSIGVSVLLFAGSQLVRLEECPQQQAYLGLFTFVIGPLLPVPSAGKRPASPQPGPQPVSVTPLPARPSEP